MSVALYIALIAATYDGEISYKGGKRFTGGGTTGRSAYEARGVHGWGGTLASPGFTGGAGGLVVRGGGGDA